jgi:hypothetical protein
VGALLSEDFHHKMRVWFLDETEASAGCANGYNVKIGAAQGGCTDCCRVRTIT